MIQLHTTEEFEDVVQQNKAFFLLKHSSTCPISRAAYEEYVKFSEAHKEVPTYFLIVQDARPLSSFIADTFQIKHESPQAFFITEHKFAWNASHWKITEKTLTEAFEQ